MKPRLLRTTLALTTFAAGAARADEITLDDALTHALGRSPAAVAAEATYIKARADLFEGWGGVMPSAAASYSAYRYYDRGVFKLGGYEIPGYAPPQHYFAGQVQINQPIFAGGALIWGVMSGRASARAGAASRNEQRDRLVVDVAKAYFGVLKAEGLKEVADASLDASRRNEELARAQYETETISRAEYLKAGVQRGTDEVAAIAAEAAVAAARLGFFNAAGIEPDETLTFADVEAGAPQELPPLADLIARATRQRPDATRIREEKRLAELTARSARAGWFPTVAASAAYSWSDFYAPAADTWNDNDEWAVGLTASWAIFDAFQTKAAYYRARAGRAVARAAYERLNDAVALDVTNVYYEYKKQAETVSVAGETAEMAEEEFAAVQQLYELGGASTLELTDAQALYVQARNSYVEARYDFLAADYELSRALGELEY
jgi:outer membrane protein